MRINIWNTYTPSTFYLLYPEYSGFFLRSFSRTHNHRCRPPFCTPPAPTMRRNPILTFLNNENLLEEDKLANITDIVIPMRLYLSNCVEPTRRLPSTSHSPYTKHHPLCNFCTNRLVHLE